MVGRREHGYAALDGAGTVPEGGTGGVVALLTKLAPRFADQDQGGEILVSSPFKELTAGAIWFGEVQEVKLKGLAWGEPGVRGDLGVDGIHLG